MPIRTLEEWAHPRLQSYPLTALKDTVIGVDAAHYLDRLLNTPPSKEPLCSALGGFPFALKTHIENDLESMQSLAIKPLFVFSGMDYVVKEKPSRESSDSVRLNSEAWSLYNQHQAVRAVETFGNSGSVKPESLFRFFQRVLRMNKVEFMVAPYSAWAQLVYLEQHPKRFVDAVMGSSELLLFDVEKVILRFDFERSRFLWLSKQTCLEDLGKISPDMFIDACLLSGSTFLPTFPPVENHRKPFSVRDTTSMLLALGPSVTAVCTHYQDEPQIQQSDYLDRYRRARLAVKHHVILADDGKVEPLDIDHAPSDVHEFIGLRLPEEVYFYLSKGLTGPRVLNWLTSGELIEYPPLDNGESQEYQRLVREQLDPYRVQALALLSQPLNRFFQRKDITMRFWFGKDAEKSLSHKDLVLSVRQSISAWNVRENVLKSQRDKVKASPGTLRFAFTSLADPEYAAKTITAKDSSHPLVSKEELLSNTLWRFLQLRGYCDDKHQLTIWGKALVTALFALDPADQLEEAAFLGIELLRLNHLNANGAFANYIGAPLRGSEVDKSNCLLVSRVACLGKLRHKPIGFTGPLSRNLLAFHSLIYSVRESLRDLTEMTLVNLLLNGDADRDRTDWTDLGLEVPFIDDYDCGLGIAVKSYLDELAGLVDPTDAESRRLAKKKGPEEWFLHCVDVKGDLDVAFRLWDAIYKAVQVAGKEVRGGDRWADTDQWLASRR